MQKTRLATGILVATGLAALAASTTAQQRPVDDTALTARERAVTIDVLANDGIEGAVQLLQVRQQPAHGSASVADGAIRYVPAAGFTGRDSFTYLVKRQRDVGIARVTVDVGEALVLRGKATDAPLAEATVSGSVDGRSFSVQADANGDYTLELISTDDGMVVLSARGTGAQSMASFISYVGDFGRLQAEAGADGVLTRDENHQVQVTNVSTAQAVLALEALAGLPIDDDAALAQGIESLDYARVMRGAAAIKLAVDEGFALPAGVADTLALMSDPQTLAGYIAAVEAEAPGALEAASQAIANDPELTLPVDEDSAAGAFNLVYNLGAPGTVSAGYFQGERFELQADGTGALLKPQENADASATWSVDGNRIVVVPNAPVVHVSFPYVEPYGQIRRHDVERQVELSSLGQSGGRELFAVTTTYDYSYPDTPALPSGTVTSTGTRAAIRDESAIAFTAADVVGTWALPTARTGFANSNGTGSELHLFAANGTGTRAGGASFDWEISADGRLQVLDGAGNRTAYSRINEDGRKGVGVIAQWTAADGARSSNWSLAMRADGSLAFDAANAARPWRSGFNVSRVGEDATANDFWIVLDPGAAPRAGFQVLQPNPASPAQATRMGWTATGAGVMDATYYRNGLNQPVHACTVGVDGCYIWQVRRWHPVAGDGDRVYVIEEFVLDLDNNGVAETVVNQRANFYDVVTRPVFTPPALKQPALPARKLRKG